MASEHSPVPTRAAEASEHAVAAQAASSAATGGGRNLFLDREGSPQPFEPAAPDPNRAYARMSSVPTQGHGPPALIVATGDVSDTSEAKTSPTASGHIPSRPSTVRNRQLAAGLATARPVSAHTALLLPARLTRAQRTRAALRALVADRPGRGSDTAPPVTGVVDPAAFALQTHIFPVRRIREAWQQSDYVRQLGQRIIAPRLQRCATIAVVSPKGGPGKTTITALLGSLLAFLRRDRVVAVDANPDFGSLGRRLVPGHPISIDDLLTGPLQNEPLSATGLDAQLGRGPDGLMVAPAPADPDRASQLDERAYRTLFERLAHHVGTLVLDCGTGLDAPPARAALDCADQLVLVTDAEPDTASLVCEAAAWLKPTGLPVVLVVNKHERSSRLDIGALERATRSPTGS